MKEWSIYELATGEFTGERFGSSLGDGLAQNVRPGFAALPGAWDADTMRVNLETGAVEKFRSPRPSPQHAWNAAAGTWELPAEQRRVPVLQRIAALEARQLRPLRELAIDPHDREARDRVSAIDAEIAALRSQLT